MHLLQGHTKSYLRDIQLNYLTEDDWKELEKEIFSSQVKTTIHSLYPRVYLWVQMVAQQNFSKHLER